MKQNIPSEKIRYVALGDSYTIGEGVSEEERYPNQLVKHLKSEGFNITLIANPALSAQTTKDILKRQLMIFEDLNPNFTTILIGANDIVQGQNANNFKISFASILDQMQQKLGNENRIIVLTIPDFSATPTGNSLAQGILAEAVIIQFNKIIKEEAQKRNLKVVDLFEISKQMSDDPTLVVSDGLHPSGKEYSEWEKLIYPTAFDLLTSQ